MMGDFIIEAPQRGDGRGACPTSSPAPTSKPWQPFPVVVFPEPVRTFIDAGAKAIGCDPAMIALPVLAVCAAAIGTTRAVRLKQSWFEPPIAWCVIVAPSGSLKSPAQDYATRALRDVQTRRVREYRAALKEFRAAMAKYDSDLSAWKRDKQQGAQPIAPDPPVFIRHVVSDTTIEALAPILLQNPRGLLLCRDELSGWVGSFNQYKKSGSDTASWLELHRAGALIVDRKTGDFRMIYVPHAAVCICGTIQPGTLRRVLVPAFFEAGLPARLLLAAPPSRRKRWTEADVESSVVQLYDKVIDALLSLQHGKDKDGEPCPVPIPLTVDARRLWIEFYNEFASQQENAEDDDLRAAFAKIEGYAPRFALVFHCIRWAASADLVEGSVDARSMAAGIQLARWFAHETERVYAMLRESDADRDDRALVEWIQGRGGRMTVRELQQGNRKYRNKADAAESALVGLVQCGVGSWEPVPTTAKGGQPTRVFVLPASSTVYATPENPGENDGSVDVDSVDGAESGDTEWTG